MAQPKNPMRSLFLRQIDFDEDPFTPAPDPRFIYLSNQHGPLLERLIGTIDSTIGMAIIDGERGTGKSIVARRLESYCACRPDSYIPVFIFNQVLDSEYATLLAIADRLVLPRRKSLDAQFTEIKNFFRQQAEEGRTIPIIIDTNELISREALTQLSVIATFSPVFIFSPPQILASLSKAADILQQADRVKIGNLSLDDTVGMMQFRCSLAGRKTPLMEQDVLISIWESAFGNPGQIIKLCGRLLNMMQEKKIETASMNLIGLLFERSESELELAQEALPIE